MSGENEQEWRVVGATVRGASHIQSNKPNQDAILWKQGELAGSLPLMLAIADGHGSEKYFRSHFGAQAAVAIALDEINSMVREIPFPVTNYTVVKQLFTEELPKGIVARWQKEVEEHWDKNPPNKEERELLRKKENASILSNPVIPYGATLLAVLVTPSFILYLQLGDGDIVMVSESGQVIKVVPADKRLIANETTSLCSTTMATVKDDFRTQLHRLEEGGRPPALIMLSTDGYSNSFTKEEGFLKAGLDIFNRLREEGVSKVKDSLPEWLKKTSEAGSGDDISLGLLFRMSTLKRPALFPLEPSANLTESSDHVMSSPGQAAGTGKKPEVTVSSPVTGNDFPGQPVNIDDERTVLRSSSDAPPVQSPATPERAGQISPPTSSLSAQVHDRKATPAQAGTVPAPEFPPVAPMPEKHVLIVSQEPGEGNYTSIGEALKHARSKTRIEVRPGTYRERESLVLTQDIELVAKGPQNAVILLGQAPCLQIQSEGAMIEGFKIHGKPGVGGLLSRDKAAVDISAGHSGLTGCNITSETSVCVWVHGPMTAPRLRKCAIYNSAGKGIIFSESAQGTLVESQVFGNRNVAIEIVDGSNPTIRHCQIRDGGDKGIFVWKGGAGRIEQCAISANQSTGIEIRREGNPIVQGCQIFENKGSGMVVDEFGQGTVIDCTISENTGHGIEVYRASAPTIKDCKLTRGKKRGIVIGEQGAGIIENCDIEEHAASGVSIAQRANPVIKNCRIHHGQSNGVLVTYQGWGKLENCEIFENALHAVEMRLESRITISGGHIRHQSHEANHAVVVTASRAMIDHCKIEAPTNVGILVQRQSNVALRSCYMRCGLFCLAVSNKSTVHVDESHLQSISVSKPLAVEQESRLYWDGEEYRS